MQNMPIGIFRGDDTDAFSYQTIVGTINTDLDLTGCKAVFRYLGFSMEFDPIPEDKKLTIAIPADETKKFPPGLGYASLRVYDSDGRLKTFSNRIMVFVATKTPMFGSDEFEVNFNVRASLEPLKFFVGPNPDDFDEYRGYLEKVIDRASAAKYGLAILLDAIDSDLGADDGVAATPVAVNAAYAAIIKKLTDDYYTADETDEAIERVAAYYITANAQGEAFATHAALVGASTYYSGGVVRVPTRNDYAVVLADETHGGAEWRYIYAVADGETTGQWEAQYPIETNDYTALSNKPQINGTTLTGNNTGAALGLLDTALVAPDWSQSNSYQQYDVVKYNGAYYYAKDDIAAGTAWNTYNWISLANLAALTQKFLPLTGGTMTGDITMGTNTILLGNNASMRGDNTDKNIVFKDLDLELESRLLPDGSRVVTLHKIAPDFSTSATYAQNALCVYNGVLYRCTAANGHTGAWAAGDFAVATVEDVLTALRTEVAGKYTKPSGGIPKSDLAAAVQISLNRADAALPSSGGVITGPLTIAGGMEAFAQYGELGILHGNNQTSHGLMFQSADGTLALLQNIAPEFSTNATYALDNLCVYRNTLYRCTTAVTTAGAWDANHWTAATVQDALAALRTGKADRAANPTAGNLAALDAQGNPTDAGWTAGDLARYALTTKTINNGAVTLDDRAINAVAVSSPLASLTVNFPTATSGKVRDFGLRLTVASGITTAPELVLPQGVTCENADGEAPEIGADGAATILYFTETASGVFLVKGEVVTAIS